MSMKIFSTTADAHLLHSGSSDLLKLTKTKYAHRVQFKPIGSNPGIYASVPAPLVGRLGSVSVLLNGAAASGTLLITTVDPTVSYPGAFLHVVCEDIPIATVGPSMWRKTEIGNAFWSTVQANHGFLYFIVLDGPAIAPGAVLPADVAITAITE